MPLSHFMLRSDVSKILTLGGYTPDVIIKLESGLILILYAEHG